MNSEYLTDSDTQTNDSQGLGNSSNQSNPVDIQALISNLTTPVLPGAAALGKENAPINIVEFGDYQDAFSARFSQEIKDELISKYVETGIARFGFKDFIVDDLFNKNLSTLDAEASYCASDQNKYRAYHDEIFRNSRGENTGGITKESLITFAKNVNMTDINQFTNCLDSHKYAKFVSENDKFAKDLGLKITPTFLILRDNSTRIAAI